MDFPNIKDLKKLAAACRKAGISNFKYMKDGSCEFSLDPNFIDTKKSNKSKKLTEQETTTDNSAFESDTLEGDSLLFWSSADVSADLTNKKDESNQ